MLNIIPVMGLSSRRLPRVKKVLKNVDNKEITWVKKVLKNLDEI